MSENCVESFKCHVNDIWRYFYLFLLSSTCVLVVPKKCHFSAFYYHYIDWIEINPQYDKNDMYIVSYWCNCNTLKFPSLYLVYFLLIYNTVYCELKCLSNILCYEYANKCIYKSDGQSLFFWFILLMGSSSKIPTVQPGLALYTGWVFLCSIFDNFLWL